MAALNTATMWRCAHTHLGASEFGSRKPRVCMSLKLRSDGERCFGGALLHRAVTRVEDDKPCLPVADPPASPQGSNGGEPPKFHKDLSFLTKPLTSSSLFKDPSDGTKVRVAYQGISGAYSQAAALKVYPKSETVPFEEFEGALKAVELWLVNKAVLLIENSTSGSIHRNYDLLLRHRLHIIGEVQLQVNHCLLGLPGTEKSDIKRVVSHPHALAQCEATLSEWGVLRISFDDTAKAAKMVADKGNKDAAAIASARAAELYGLTIISDKIQDDEDNVSRFLILAREPVVPGTDRPYKTSVVFTLDEGPGILFKALAAFYLRDIRLSKIESRPQKQNPIRMVDGSMCFDYLFYIDFEASMAEPRAQYALEHLQEMATFLRVLGSYPMDTAPLGSRKSNGQAK